MVYKLHPQCKGNMIYYRSSRDTNKKRQTERKIQMILQIDNVVKELREGEPVNGLVDYVNGITHTKAFSDGIKCFKKDGTEILIIRKNQFEVEVENLDHYDGFKIYAVYLLNDEGKTLRKLA